MTYFNSTKPTVFPIFDYFDQFVSISIGIIIYFLYYRHTIDLIFLHFICDAQIFHLEIHFRYYETRFFDDFSYAFLVLLSVNYDLSPITHTWILFASLIASIALFIAFIFSSDWALFIRFLWIITPIPLYWFRKRYFLSSKKLIYVFDFER